VERRRYNAAHVSTIDRYIARQFLLNIAILVAILFSFIVAIDLSLNFGEFMDLAAARGKTQQVGPGGAIVSVEAGAVRRILLMIFLVFDYWWPKLLQLGNYLIGLIVIGAMGFTCTQLSRYREFVAAVAGGVSLFRVMRPFVLVALLMTLIQAANFEYVIPRIADLIQRDREQASQRRLDSLPVRLVPDSQRRLFYARGFDAATGVMKDLTIIERGPNGPAIRTINAREARWRDGGWDLTDAVAESRTSQTAPKEKVDRVVTDLDPTAIKIARFSGYSQSLSWRQITEMLERPERLGLALTGEDDPAQGAATATRQQRVDELQRVRFGRIAMMVCNMLALLLVTPFFLKREPSNMMLESIKAAPIAVLGVMGGVLGASAAIPGLPAAVGVFVPALILLPLSIAAVTSVRT
jgi:lipopolysaccharide export system permease protein